MVLRQLKIQDISFVGFVATLALTLAMLLFTFGKVCVAELPIIKKFATIKQDKVNVRKGPASTFDIIWMFSNKGSPVEILYQSENWVMIKDFNGSIGWVPENSIGYTKRSAIINERFTYIYRMPDLSHPKLAIIEKGSLVQLSSCDKKWCRISIDNITGWVEKKTLWGVLSSEEL